MKGNEGEGFIYEFIGHLACVMALPTVLYNHIVHTFFVICSVLAVLFSCLLEVLFGRNYPQLVQYTYHYLDDVEYDELPMWYVCSIVYPHNYITRCHKYMIELISDDYNDYDDYSGAV